jgi:hypothetical protein
MSKEPLRRPISGLNAKDAEVTICVPVAPGRTWVMELKGGRLETYEETDVVLEQTPFKTKRRKK